MNIYCCWRDFSGFGLSAVVSAESEARAIEMLGWTKDEDTLEIKVEKIGISDRNEEVEWCEESL